MLDNKKTTDLIKQELENDLFLLEMLKEDLVNYTALSRRLLPKIKKNNNKATIESISVAMKRYISNEKKEKSSETMKKIISNSKLSTKNDVIHMAYRRNEKVLKKIMDVSKKINWDNEEIFFINQGFGEVTIILDYSNKNLLDDLKEDLLDEIDSLAILSIKESFQKNLEKSINVPGVYSYFISQVSRKGINIVEIISTLSQLTLLLKNDDLMKAYSIIEGNVKHFRNK